MAGFGTKLGVMTILEDLNAGYARAPSPIYAVTPMELSDSVSYPNRAGAAPLKAFPYES